MSADTELSNMERHITELKDELTNYSLKVDKYLKEISSIKTDNINKSNEIINLNQQINHMNENYSILEDESRQLKNNIIDLSQKNNNFGLKLTDLIQRIFEGFKSIKSKRYQKYFELINFQAYSESRVNYLYLNNRVKKY